MLTKTTHKKNLFTSFLAWSLCTGLLAVNLLSTIPTDFQILEIELLEIELEEEKSSDQLNPDQLSWEDADDYLHPKVSDPQGKNLLSFLRVFAFPIGWIDSHRIILPPPEFC